MITFPFTDLSGTKLRPAVVLASSLFDVTVSFITTPIEKRERTDILLLPNPINNLRKVSIIRTEMIATLDRSLAKGLLGKLVTSEVDELNNSLKFFLQIP